MAGFIKIAAELFRAVFPKRICRKKKRYYENGQPMYHECRRTKGHRGYCQLVIPVYVPVGRFLSKPRYDVLYWGSGLHGIERTQVPAQRYLFHCITCGVEQQGDKYQQFCIPACDYQWPDGNNPLMGNWKDRDLPI